MTKLDGISLDKYELSKFEIIKDSAKHKCYSCRKTIKEQKIKLVFWRNAEWTDLDWQKSFILCSKCWKFPPKKMLPMLIKHDEDLLDDRDWQRYDVLGRKSINKVKNRLEQLKKLEKRYKRLKKERK